MRREETESRFRALSRVKLSDADKADILQSLRKNMEAERNQRPRRHAPKRSVNRWLQASVAVAAVAIVAGVYGAAVHQGASSPEPAKKIPNTTNQTAPVAVRPPLSLPDNIQGMKMVKSGAGVLWSVHGGFQLYSTFPDGRNIHAITLPVTPPVNAAYTGPLGLNPRPVFLNASDGWVVWLDQNTAQVRVLRTRDGGVHWTSSAFHTGVPQSALVKVDFVSPSTGWILTAGDPGMLHAQKTLFVTHDGGASWTQAGGNSLHSGTEADIRFIGPKDGWYAANNLGGATPNVFHSTDGGLTWTQVTVSVPAGFQNDTLVDVTAPVFNGEDGSFTAAYENGSKYRGVVFHTTDGGATWKGCALPAGAGKPTFDQNGTPAMFVDGDHGFTFESGALMSTSDGGQHWAQLDAKGLPIGNGSAYKTVDLDFVSLEEGYALFSDSSGKTHVYATTDGGKSWSKL